MLEPICKCELDKPKLREHSTENNHTLCLHSRELTDLFRGEDAIHCSHYTPKQSDPSPEIDSYIEGILKRISEKAD